MAVGCFGLWKAALAFDFARGYRLWTIAQHKIDGLISNETNYQRRKGMGGGSRLSDQDSRGVPMPRAVLLGGLDEPLDLPVGKIFTAALANCYIY